MIRFLEIWRAGKAWESGAQLLFAIFQEVLRYVLLIDLVSLLGFVFVFVFNIRTECL